MQNRQEHTEPETVETQEATSVDESTSAEQPSPENQESADAAVSALQKEMEAMLRRVEEAEKRAIYTQAEFQNFRRRKEDEMAGVQKFANAELIKGLLPILDNFERALKAAEQSRNFDALVSGVSGILKQMDTFLQKAGVAPIVALGQEFDPQYHEAIGQTETEEYPANTVAEEVQRGYTMQDRVLRPSLVKVASGA